MTWKWTLLIVLAIVAALLIVWVALKAINGIWFEIETMMRTLEERQDEGGQAGHAGMRLRGGRQDSAECAV